MMVPVLTTERLLLRAHRLEDFPAYAALSADPRVAHAIGVEPRTEEESWLRFQSRVGQWDLLGYGYWIAEERSSGRVIGGLGFIHAKRQIDLPIAGAPEIGWALMPEFHGRGLAREGVGAAVRWGDEHLDAPRTWCMIDTDNDISRKVAERVGYRQTGTADYKTKRVMVFERGRQAA